MAELNDVMLALGRVQEGIDRLTQAQKEEKDAARESRKVIHERLDDQAGEIAALKTDIAIVGNVDAQVREELKAVHEKIDHNQKYVAPSVEEWKRMKMFGLGIAGLLAIGGLSIGAVIVWAGEVAVSTVRQWLRIT